MRVCLSRRTLSLLLQTSWHNATVKNRRILQQGILGPTRNSQTQKWLHYVSGTAGQVDAAEFIKSNTEVSTDHLTPEIKLRLITPNCPLWFSRGDDCIVPDPFWAFYWPGGQALSRYLLDNPSIVKDKTVLDVGSGCGATAIGATLSGAKKVTANDICEVAAEAMRMNAELNNVQLEIDTRNLIGQQNNNYDIVLFGDMFYDEDLTNEVFDWIDYLHKNKTTVLIGDPGRIYLNSCGIRTNLNLVSQIELPPGSIDEYGLSYGYVWRYQPHIPKIS